MGYLTLEVRPCACAPWPEPGPDFPVPTVEQVFLTLERVPVFPTERRRAAADMLPHVLSDRCWTVAGGGTRSVRAYDGTRSPDVFCREVHRVAPRGGDEATVRAVQDAATLVLVWHADRVCPDADARCSLLEQHCTVEFHQLRRPATRQRPSSPTPAQKRARTCAMQPALRRIVEDDRDRKRTLERDPSEYHEFGLIRKFLRERQEGHAILRDAGVDPHTFELDHFFADSIGGNEVLENAYILPKDGSNQRFGNRFDTQKFNFYGPDQVRVFRENLLLVVGAPPPGTPTTTRARSAPPP